MVKEVIELLASLPDDPENSVRIRVKASGEEKLLTGVYLKECNIGDTIEADIDGNVWVTFKYDYYKLPDENP